MKKVFLAGVISALAAVSTQADYQFEANIGYLTGDAESVDFDGFDLAASIYFDTVDTSKGPLSEAAFLSKSSSISLSNISTELKDFDFELINTTSISGRFVLDNDYIVEVSYEDQDSDLTEDTTIGLGIGKYLSDSSEIVVSIETADESETDSLGVDYHSVNDLTGSASISYDLGAAYVDGTDDSGYQLIAGLTYYPSTQLGLGAKIDLLSVGDSDITILSFDAEYFFNENIAGIIGYSTADTDLGDGSSTVDTITLGVTARF